MARRFGPGEADQHGRCLAICFVTHVGRLGLQIPAGTVGDGGLSFNVDILLNTALYIWQTMWITKKRCHIFHTMNL